MCKTLIAFGLLDDHDTIKYDAGGKNAETSSDNDKYQPLGQNYTGKVQRDFYNNGFWDFIQSTCYSLNNILMGWWILRMALH